MRYAVLSLLFLAAFVAGCAYRNDFTPAGPLTAGASVAFPRPN